MKLITISGNIGAGKTTLIESLKQWVSTRIDYKGKVVFVKEPLDAWNTFKCDNGVSLFNNYYDEISPPIVKKSTHYSFYFQIMALNSRIDAVSKCIEDNPNAELIIMERSPYDDYFVFASMLNMNSFISNEEYKLLGQFLQVNWENRFSECSFALLETDPETCLIRIRERSRDGESNINLTFLQDIEIKTRSFLHSKCHDYFKIPATYLNNRDEVYTKFLDKFLEPKRQDPFSLFFRRFYNRLFNRFGGYIVTA